MFNVSELIKSQNKTVSKTMIHRRELKESTPDIYYKLNVTL